MIVLSVNETTNRYMLDVLIKYYTLNNIAFVINATNGVYENRKCKIDKGKMPEDVDVSVYKKLNREYITNNSKEIFQRYYELANNGHTFNIDTTLFLINDSNSELYNHFECRYIDDIEFKKVIEVLKYKNDFCVKQNTKYIFGINPDKSFCLQNIINNNNNNCLHVNRFFVDVFNKHIMDCSLNYIDFYDALNGVDNIEDYVYKTDSHVNSSCSLLYVCYLNKFLNLPYLRILN